MKARRRRGRPAARRRDGEAGGPGIGQPARRFATDPGSRAMAEIHRVQPYQALKEYLCPGCNQEIRVGVGHVVVVPLAEPAHRRHWHTPCYERTPEARRGEAAG